MDQNHQHQRGGFTPAREFSTRFLSTGIPEYNALLDHNLGKRREFLLGNRQSLALMQQTGVIERVEEQPDNPNQYVVHIAEKTIHRRKRLPPRSNSGPLLLAESHETPWRHNSAPGGNLPAYSSSSNRSVNSIRKGHASSSKLQKSSDSHTELSADKDAAKKANVATLKGLSRSYSANTALNKCKPVLKSSASNRLALFGSTKCSALLESAGAGDSLRCDNDDERDTSLTSASDMRQRRQSALPANLTPAIDEFKARHSISKRSVAAPSTLARTHQPVVKGTVEHLLESDAAFMAQIRVMKEQLAELEAVKTHLDAEVALLRRKLRGVNAVRENDVAVAHCSSIMQHRLSKAEEEFMKLVTQQQEAKVDVDRVRHELLSMRKVRHKLQTDIEDVTQANQALEEKIYATKIVRNQLSEGLSELEHQAEMELEEQKLNLPPEDAVVVDVAKLMSAVQERNVTRRHAYSDGHDVNLSVALASLHLDVGALSPGSAIVRASLRKGLRRGNPAETPKPLLDHLTAFRVLQNSLGFADMATFEQQFTTAEEQLLSKYKANLALTDELASLERELVAVNTEKKANRANVRGIMQASEKAERDMQARIQATLRNIRSYNELREQRNREHARLRSIMVRCLEALQLDARSSKLSGDDTNTVGGGISSSGSGGSVGRTLHLSEMQSPELLEMLQRKMTQVAVTIKVKHSSHMFELPPEALRLNRGHDGRRSNMFSTREVSKIVLGPREPSGSALLSILGTAQAPSVDAALALTENLGMMEVMRGLHRSTSPARRRASSLSPHPPVIGQINESHNNTGSISPVVLMIPDTGSEEASKSTLNSMSPGGHKHLATRPSLEVMTEADKEDEDEDEDENGDPQNDEQINDNNVGSEDIDSTEDDGDELDALVL